MFIPMAPEECQQLNWDSLDVILVTGDAYIDSSFVGVAIIGKWLIKHGLKVGIISQPRLDCSTDILRLGHPALFWGITAGAMDSMVANYTASRKKRQTDDLTPGGINNKRPDRAVIRYSNLVQQYSKHVPIVIGGLEASLRRISHYDYWTDSIRKPILLDAKANILVYGEGEKTILTLAKYALNNKSKNKQDWLTYDNLIGIRGICFATNSLDKVPANYIRLPDHIEILHNKANFNMMFEQLYQNADPLNANGLIQKIDNRYVIQNPPSYYLENDELDAVYELDYENDAHPICCNIGKIKALETTKFSITTHRGCFGECNFCAITVHFGRKIRSRSMQSIIKEATTFSNNKSFKHKINDLGGATSNMYKMECKKQNLFGSCKNKRCLFPKPCNSMKLDHSNYLKLIKNTMKIPKIKQVFINSGVRYDLIQYDKINGMIFFEFATANCVSGQMKIAPEHIDANVLNAMGKPSADLPKFVTCFNKISQKNKKKQFLTYYLIAGHPTSSPTRKSIKNEIQYLKSYFKRHFNIVPEQIQIFTPTPSTYSTLMYHNNVSSTQNNVLS